VALVEEYRAQLQVAVQDILVLDFPQCKIYRD